MRDEAIANVATETDIVFKEIEEYISTLNINDEFELYDASETFRNIPMTKEGKPNVNRAKLGRLFGQSIGKKPFENVERVYIANGNVKKSRYNKAKFVFFLQKLVVSDPLERSRHVF